MNKKLAKFSKYTACYSSIKTTELEKIIFLTCYPSRCSQNERIYAIVKNDETSENFDKSLEN